MGDWWFSTAGERFEIGESGRVGKDSSLPQCAIPGRAHWEKLGKAVWKVMFGANGCARDVL